MNDQYLKLCVKYSDSGMVAEVLTKLISLPEI